MYDAAKKDNMKPKKLTDRGLDSQNSIKALEDKRITEGSQRLPIMTILEADLEESSRDRKDRGIRYEVNASFGLSFGAPEQKLQLFY